MELAWKSFWLTKAAGRLVQTVYAGDGYLSQSSKTLNFGLGQAGQGKEGVQLGNPIRHVEVRWPGSVTESFADVQPNRRYELVEGSGRARETTARSFAALSASRQAPLATETAPRFSLANPVPLPILSYRSLDEEPFVQTVSSVTAPKLIVLWASWCPTCARELQQLTRQAPEFCANRAGGYRFVRGWFG